ncbi:hypothetical protein [Eubacterium callanderi]|uniref:Uncharacterized protein n=1 Tax=Eubacterium callanderi TaxID=53442 RepID=A0A853JTF5_9FIRM|nr:hypothetical protein [Eubacterium callanderi]
MRLDFMPYDFCKINCPLQALVIETEICGYASDPYKTYKNSMECTNREACRAFLAFEKGSEK